MLNRDVVSRRADGGIIVKPLPRLSPKLVKIEFRLTVTRKTLKIQNDEYSNSNQDKPDDGNQDSHFVPMCSIEILLYGAGYGDRLSLRAYRLSLTTGFDPCDRDRQKIAAPQKK